MTRKSGKKSETGVGRRRSSQNKTHQTEASVAAFLDAVEPDRRRADARVLLEIMQRITGEPAVLWGSSIIGFGRYHYRYDSGREGDSMKAGFSPRKQRLVVYIMAGFDGADELRERLGKHRTGKSCLYINKLSDVDLAVLEKIIARDWRIMTQRYAD